MSIGSFRIAVSIMYRKMTSAIPDTMADMRNTIGISTLLHHGFAFTEPKMKPT